MLGQKRINRLGKIIYDWRKSEIRVQAVTIKKGILNKEAASPVLSASETRYFCWTRLKVLSPLRTTSQTRLIEEDEYYDSFSVD
jgi:hypothetical protein